MSVAIQSDVRERATAARTLFLTQPNRPPRSGVNPDGIPDEIKALTRWVCWKWEQNKKRTKWTKKPVQVDGSPASSTAPKTWATFTDSLECYESNEDIAGIGFVLGDEYCGVDLDSCYDPAEDEAGEVITDVVNHIASYAEISPTQTGVKILAKGSLPSGRRSSPSDAKWDVECYDHGRFFTITGQRWRDTTKHVNGAARELQWFHSKYVEEPRPTKAPGNLAGFTPDCKPSQEPDDIAKAREAIRNIPANYADCYEDWIRVGMGAKSLGGDVLLNDWIQWSSQSPKFEGQDDCEAKWRSFGDSPSIRIGTLVDYAKKGGWSPSWKSNCTSWSGGNNVVTKLAKADEEASKAIEPISIGGLIDGYPTLREPIIEGLLRKGETANFIAAAKVGKSFLAGGLAWSIASGTPWLGHQVAEGRVAIIDNELHKQTLANRLYRIATDMMIDYREHADAIDVFSLRGVGVDIHNIGRALASIEPGKYQLVILDALYRTLPEGTSENDNAAMMAIYNRLDHYATQWDCSIVVVHHASKGDQSGKAITDVGAGAGSISRAADTHLTVRPHEDPELSVLECVTRSFLSPPPKSVKFDWPLWSEVAADPVLKAQKPRSEAQQEAKDAESEKAVRGVLDAADDWLAASAIRRKVGFGQTRVDRALVRLADEIECQAIENPRNRREEIDVYRIRKQAS